MDTTRTGPGPVLFLSDEHRHAAVLDVYERLEDRRQAIPALRQGGKKEGRLLRYQGMPDGPPTRKQLVDLRRYWKRRDEFLTWHEQRLLVQSVKENKTYRNLAKQLDWLAKISDIRTGEF